MKRKSILIVLAVVLTTVFSACQGGAPVDKADEPSAEAGAQVRPTETEKPKEKLRVVTTNFPGYDFTRAIAGDLVELSMLLPPGAESHSFEPTPQDIVKIQNSDVFLYVGGDSDTWATGLLASMDVSTLKILSMMDMVETVEEELKEGMSEDHGHDHGHSHDHDHEEDHEQDHSHDEEIKPESIYKRPLTDWAGDWTPVEAELHPALSIKGSSVQFGDTAAEYTDIGWLLTETDHGTAVWYGFETEAEGVPARIAFSDHGTGAPEDHQAHDEHDGELPHFHFRYGSDSLEALVAMEDSATYFPAGTTESEIEEAMSAHDHSHSHDGEAVYDEHVWTSPLNAKKIGAAIAEVLCTLDEENAQHYQANATQFAEKLEALDKDFRAVTETATRKTLIFGDRFPFRYFVDTYGLDYYAAFPGCATETEPSAKTVAFLMDKVQEEQIPVVFHIELSNEKMADTLCESTGAKKLLLHSCHNITKAEFESGVTYLELMRQNVESLKEALR